MANQVMMAHIVESQPPASSYSYPATAHVIEFKNNNQKLHLILGTDSGGKPGALYAKAPNGSIYVALSATQGEQNVYVKFGATGLTDGTWRQVGSGLAANSGYIVKCLQSSTSAPTIGTTLSNTLGETPAIARTGAGVYTFTTSAAVFSTTKTIVRLHSRNSSAARILHGVVTSTTVITVYGFDAATPSAADTGDFDMEIINLA